MNIYMLKKKNTFTVNRLQLTKNASAAYLRFAELAELLAQVGGVLLQAVEVELHLQAADAAHCIRGRRWHQS